MDRVVVSVRTIAEFSMESGDLYPNMDAYERMQDGAQAHKRLQMAYGEGAKAEVAVALDAEVEGVPMRVQGRIDGLHARLVHGRQITRPLGSGDFQHVHRLLRRHTRVGDQSPQTG